MARIKRKIIKEKRIRKIFAIFRNGKLEVNCGEFFNI
jgi:hypothetical protein